MDSSCVHYRHERDTGASYCAKDQDLFGDGRDPCNECPEYYTKEDAKADAKNEGRDRLY